MVHQTSSVNGASRAEEGPWRGAVGGLGAVLGNSIDLAGLQLRLVKTDAAGAAQKVRPVAIASILAFGMILSSLPLIGLGLASLLSALTTLVLWQSQLIVGGTFLLIAGMLLMWCWSALKRLGNAFNRSQHEAQRNLQWLRNAVKQISR